MTAFGRLLPKKVLKFTPIEYSLTGSNRRSTHEVVFIPFRPGAVIGECEKTAKQTSEIKFRSGLQPEQVYYQKRVPE
jgi:hypothetical protein